MKMKMKVVHSNFFRFFDGFKFDMKLIYGILSFIFIILLYILVNTAVSSFEYALFQFGLYWRYVLAIAMGFGLQMYLFGHIRNFNVSCKSVATSGGMSVGSMVACCLHHVTDFLPIIGSAGGLLILSYYVEPLLMLGVLSSWTGVVFMLAVIQRHNLYGKSVETIFSSLNFEKVKYLTLVFSILISLYYFLSYQPFSI
jgi:hypothetical protein